MNEFERNEVWKLVPRPKNRSIVGTKWVFRNKTDSDGKIIRDRARLVAKGYPQQEMNWLWWDFCSCSQVRRSEYNLFMLLKRNINFSRWMSK